MLRAALRGTRCVPTLLRAASTQWSREANTLLGDLLRFRVFMDNAWKLASSACCWAWLRAAGCGGAGGPALLRWAGPTTSHYSHRDSNETVWRCCSGLSCLHGVTPAKETEWLTAGLLTFLRQLGTVYLVHKRVPRWARRRQKGRRCYGNGILGSEKA